MVLLFCRMLYTAQHSWSVGFDLPSSCLAIVAMNIVSDKGFLLVDIGQTRLDGNTTVNRKQNILNVVIPIILDASWCDISKGVILNSNRRKGLVVRLPDT